MNRARWLLGWSCGFALVMAGSWFGLRFFDGPLQVFHGGPLRSGEFVEFADVNWSSYDEVRELEVEFVRTGRSTLLWFSVTEGHPYVSCGFGCQDGWFERWPSRLGEDPRVVVRLAGVRVRGRAEPIAPHSEEHRLARRDRRAKFNADEDTRANAERAARDAIVALGSRTTGDEKTAAPSDRLFKIVAP